MDFNIPRIHLLFLLLALFTFLFILQIWAMIRIKRMLKAVLGIYTQVSRLARTVRTGQVPANAPKRICQNCKYRDTYLEKNGDQLFQYRCRLNGQVIRLIDFCHCFESDPLRTET